MKSAKQILNQATPEELCQVERGLRGYSLALGFSVFYTGMSLATDLYKGEVSYWGIYYLILFTVPFFVMWVAKRDTKTKIKQGNKREHEKTLDRYQNIIASGSKYMTPFLGFWLGVAAMGCVLAGILPLDGSIRVSVVVGSISLLGMGLFDLGPRICLFSWLKKQQSVKEDLAVSNNSA